MKQFRRRTSLLVLLLLLLINGGAAADYERDETNWLAFIQQGGRGSQVVLLDPDSGTTQILSNSIHTHLRYSNLSWSPDGNSLLFEDRDGIYRLYLDGTIERLLLAKSEYVHFLSPSAGSSIQWAARRPLWSPDGRWIALVHSKGDLNLGSTHRLYLLDTTIPGEQTLVDLRFISDVSLDTDRLTNYNSMIWSPDSSYLVFKVPVPLSSQHDIYRLDITSGETQVLVIQGILSFSWSPDGQWIAFVGDDIRTGLWNVFLVHPDGSGQRALIPGGDSSYYGGVPVWSPDGQWIAVVRENSPSWGYSYLYRMRADGSDNRPIALSSSQSPVVWSPDGEWLAYFQDCVFGAEFQQCLYRVRASGGKPQLLVRSAHYLHGLAWRPVR